MSARRSVEGTQRRRTKLEPGDRVVMPDGRSARLVIAQGNAAIVHDGSQPAGARYALVAVATLVRA